MTKEDEKEKPKRTEGYKDTFDEYHRMFREELGENTEISVKIINLENILLLWDTLVSNRYSQEYLKQKKELQDELRQDKQSLNNSTTKSSRLRVLVKWAALILEKEPRLTLDENLQRVDFGD